MALIGIITEVPGGIPEHAVKQFRRTTRTLLTRDIDGKSCFIEYRRDMYLGVLGGEINVGESVVAAFRREIREEAGCEIRTFARLGTVREYAQDGFTGEEGEYFLARTPGTVVPPEYTDSESAGKPHPVWLTLHEARERFARQVKGLSRYRAEFLLDAVSDCSY